MLGLKPDSLERVRESKRGFPFDGLVRHLIEAHPTKRGVLKASEVSKKIFEMLKPIPPSEYRKQRGPAEKALEHMRLYDEYLASIGSGSWRDHSWEQLASTAGKKVTEAPARAVHHHFTSLVTHAIERYAWSGGIVKRLAHNRFEFKYLSLWKRFRLWLGKRL